MNDEALQNSHESYNRGLLNEIEDFVQHKTSYKTTKQTRSRPVS